MSQYHLQISDGDVAPYVLLPGDPGRVPTIAARWDEARHVATNREFVTYTGVYQGAPITCTSTGIGAPSTSIAMEELARCGATSFIRLGTAGTSFFAGHPRPGSSFGGYWQSWWSGHFADLQRQNVLAAEMEASVIFVLARLWGLRAGGGAVVLDNMLTVSGDEGEFDPDTQLEHSAESIERLALFGCELVRTLAEHDQQRARDGRD